MDVTRAMPATAAAAASHDAGEDNAAVPYGLWRQRCTPAAVEAPGTAPPWIGVVTAVGGRREALPLAASADDDDAPRLVAAALSPPLPQSSTDKRRGGGSGECRGATAAAGDVRRSLLLGLRSELWTEASSPAAVRRGAASASGAGAAVAERTLHIVRLVGEAIRHEEAVTPMQR